MYSTAVGALSSSLYRVAQRSGMYFTGTLCDSRFYLFSSLRVVLIFLIKLSFQFHPRNSVIFCIHHSLSADIAKIKTIVRCMFVNQTMIDAKKYLVSIKLQ